jgi:trigger factor
VCKSRGRRSRRGSTRSSASCRARPSCPAFARQGPAADGREACSAKTVREELARDIVQETFQTAVTKHETVALTQPVLEEGTLTKGQTFAYAARFEVPPLIEPKEYTGVQVRRRPSVVDESKVEALLKAKQDELTEVRPIPEGTERETKAGDVWTLDIEGKLGDVNLSRKDLKLEIGDANEFLPGLHKALEGTPLSAVGTTRTITFLPTQERIRTELRDKEVNLTVGFREVREKHVPALDDEFARDTGDAETLEALRAKYGDQVREEDQNEAERDARKRLVEALLERNRSRSPPRWSPARSRPRSTCSSVSCSSRASS